MAKFTPKPPAAGISKFERRLGKMANYDPFTFGGKMVRYEREEAAQEHRRLGGCGDPNCDMCNPKDGLGGKAPGGSGSSRDRSATYEYLRSAMDSMAFASTAYTNSASERRNEGDRAYGEAREKVKDYLLETSHTTNWDDVVGNEKARTALLEAIEHPVKHADLYQFYGMKLSKGVMLYGPPGCGKTMFGKAAASAMARMHGKSVELLVINGPSIQSPWVGKTEETIRDIFGYAREYKRKHGHQLVIFIDEADAILKSRTGTPMWNASNVATFLTEMDGMENSGAFVILATNRPEELDEALLRDGRCDRKIKVERPDYLGSISMLSKAISGMPTTENTSTLAATVVDYLVSPKHILDTLTNTETSEHYHFTLSHIVSGAMVVGLANRAKGIAFRRDMETGERSGVTLADFTSAVDEVVEENKGIPHAYAMLEFLRSLPEVVAKQQEKRRLN